MNSTNKETTIPIWIKAKGYLHLTPNINVIGSWREIKSKIENPKFIEKYAFYPLIHSIIKERKYKKIDTKKFEKKNDKIRSHKLKSIKTGKTESAAKNRPLHYASHFDALIYAYYASLLQKKYEEKLGSYFGLSECVTAYRKLKINPNLPDDAKGNGKSTIHFAKEIFDTITERSKKENIAALAFDIKSFFPSLDHKRLKLIWETIIDVEELPKHHLNVFKACTKFSYVLLDDLRIYQKNKGKKAGFDEKKLSLIRKTKGFKCFFESNQDFRNHIKSGKLKIHKFPFRNKETKEIMGIPQGLPISAILANMYLYYFDLSILENLVNNKNCYYRRYSDDIIVVCKVEQINEVKEFVELQMKENIVEISIEKTETFIFKNIEFNKAKEIRLTSIKINSDGTETLQSPLTYLGFEFRGYNTLIKSTNIAKFYRRIKSIIRRRSRRAILGIQKDPFQQKAIYINQIKKLFKTIPKKKDSDNENSQLIRSRKILVPNHKGEFNFEEGRTSPKKQSNYFSYLKRASKIMNEDKIEKQLRKSKHILHSSIAKYLNK
ncbi:reverse transcriptase domain-containing protein [Flavobacterium sp. GT2N3]|uniref:reverse transcriptase domain-containing protein n=1 Tax=unclassified Flavobacterium TaxID=196869 RepID=UPI003AAB791B